LTEHPSTADCNTTPYGREDRAVRLAAD